MIDELDINKAKESMKTAVIKTFENTAFIQVMDVEEPEEKMNYENILSIDILKPISSKIIMFLSNKLKKKIIENVFSTEDSSLIEDQKTDSILEILNILAGNFLMAYFNKKVEYKMELPHLMINIDEKELINKKNKDNNENFELYFYAEDFPFQIIFVSVRYWY